MTDVNDYYEKVGYVKIESIFEVKNSSINIPLNPHK